MAGRRLVPELLLRGGERDRADAAGGRGLQPAPAAVPAGARDARQVRLGELALTVARIGSDREHAQERLLRHLDPADLLHPLLPFLLLLEQLALARDVAAVALGDHVLAHGLDRFARDDLRADRRLDRDLELLARDLLAQPLGQRTT